MQIRFFLLLAENFPAEHTDEQSLILLDTGLEVVESDSVIPNEDLSFMTTLLIKSPEAEPALSQFRAWWAENAGGELTLDLLANESAQLAPDRAEVLEGMELGAWSFSSNLVAFSATSCEAQNEARQFIRECDLQTH